MQGSFIRLGENDDDIEQKTIGDDGWELINVVRYIELGFNHGENDEDIRGDMHKKVEA